MIFLCLMILLILFVIWTIFDNDITGQNRGCDGRNEASEL